MPETPLTEEARMAYERVKPTGWRRLVYMLGREQGDCWTWFRAGFYAARSTGQERERALRGVVNRIVNMDARTVTVGELAAIRTAGRGALKLYLAPSTTEGSDTDIDELVRRFSPRERALVAERDRLLHNERAANDAASERSENLRAASRLRELREVLERQDLPTAARYVGELETEVSLLGLFKTAASQGVSDAAAE